MQGRDNQEERRRVAASWAAVIRELSERLRVRQQAAEAAAQQSASDDESGSLHSSRTPSPEHNAEAELRSWLNQPRMNLNEAAHTYLDVMPHNIPAMEQHIEAIQAFIRRQPAENPFREIHRRIFDSASTTADRYAALRELLASAQRQAQDLAQRIIPEFLREWVLGMAPGLGMFSTRLLNASDNELHQLAEYISQHQHANLNITSVITRLILQNAVQYPMPLNFQISLGDNVYEGHNPRVRVENIRRDPAQEFMAAVRRNDREAVDAYVSAHSQDDNLYVTLSTAVNVAAHAQHLNMAAHLMQLATNAEPTIEAPASDEDVVLLNRNEERLQQCNFTGTVPESLCCSATKDIMVHPVTPCSGRPLERSSLKKMLENKDCCACPIKRAIILKDELENGTDICLSAYIEAFVSSNGELSLSQIERLLQCPITKALFTDPVTFACGLTLEREAAEKLFAGHSLDEIKYSKGNNVFFINRSELSRATNNAIKSLVEDYLAARKKQHDANEPVRAARIKLFNTPLLAPCDGVTEKQCPTRAFK